jgi:hypothetical protein
VVVLHSSSISALGFLLHNSATIFTHQQAFEAELSWWASTIAAQPSPA